MITSTIYHKNNKNDSFWTYFNVEEYKKECFYKNVNNILNGRETENYPISWKIRLKMRKNER